MGVVRLDVWEDHQPYRWARTSYTLHEVAERFGVSPGTVARWCKDAARRSALGAYRDVVRAPGRKTESWHFRVSAIDACVGQQDGVSYGSGKEAT